MVQRRIIYFMILVGGLVFYWAHREWLSAMLLMVILLTPLLSLLLSLPAMLSCRLQLQCPSHVTLGNPARVSIEKKCLLPAPAVKGKLRLLVSVTGKKRSIAPGAALPTDRCTALRLQCRYMWVCDYLGLFCLPIGLREDRKILVRPVPVKPAQLPDLSSYLCNIVRPKPGGGYSENHELRLYRPGDNLRQIHWKLSAKAGKLVIREPMEAARDAALVTMELRGDPGTLDRKLGRLLWISTYLAENGVPHRICCLTGSGMESRFVTNETEALAALDVLLCCGCAAPEDAPVFPAAAWRYHIGGDDHED